MSSHHPQTEVLNRGYVPEWSEGAVIPPVFRTSTFVFKNAEEGKAAFEIAYGLRKPKEGEVPALIYSRVANPNSEIFESKITVWDDKADAAVLMSSGMGAISTTCLSFLRPGDHIAFSDPVYGGTEMFMRTILPSFQIPSHPFPAGSSEAEIEAAVNAAGGKCKVIYVETPANPTITVTDLKAASRVAKKHGCLLIVDNTFCGPVFCQPHKWGADVVVYSATKFIGGHSDVVAGVATGSVELVSKIKVMRTVLGSISEPDSAWLLTRSLSTLELRMRAEADNAKKIVDFLLKHPAVEKVFYPGCETMGEEQVRIFKEQYSGSGANITFLVKGGEKESFIVLNNLHHFKLAVSLGGVESLIQHPSSMTHSDMTPEEKKHAGITDNMIRTSIGVENVEDLIADLKGALDLLL